MKIRLFYHSLLSDWNHGNAHFLRGVVSELQFRGHDVVVFEPADGWSYMNLVAEHGEFPIRQFKAAYPGLESVRYDLGTFDVKQAIGDADLVIVHAWNDPELVRKIGRLRLARDFVLLFHDTHYLLVNDRATMQEYELVHFDGVLAYGAVLRDLYLSTGCVRHAWTWHEAADLRVFHPVPSSTLDGDLVWVGNWGDGERSAELHEFLIEPARRLKLRASVYGVRYPDHAIQALANAGIAYRGWVPNFQVPEVFSRHLLTVHVPRRPYVEALPGIPTITLFEAMACGIPLICSPWNDTEGLFKPERDFLKATTGEEMTAHLNMLLVNEGRRRELSVHALATIRTRHTCAHRVDELMAIANQVRGSARTASREAASRPREQELLPFKPMDERR